MDEKPRVVFALAKGDLAGVCFTHLKIIAVAEAAACRDAQPKSTKKGAIKHQGKED